MAGRLRVGRRGAALLAVAVVAVAGLGGTALAGHLESGVKSYAGCLVTSSGAITKVKEGNTPLGGACTSGSVEVHFSGGDITKISVTGGLTGGGDNGEVTIGLDPTYSLPQNCTAPTNVAKFDGTAWVCAADNDTHYFAGTGLDVTASGIFSIEPGYRVKNTPDCSSGQFATGFDSSGTIQCSAPAAAALQAFGSTQSEPGFSEGIGIPDDGVWRTYASAQLPPGSYLLIGKGTLDRDGTSEASPGFEDPRGERGYCRLFNGAQLDVASIDVPEDSESFDAFPFALLAPSSGGQVELQCMAIDADAVGVREARFVAVKLS